MAPERFNLTWQQFENCVSSSFKELLESEHFVDVTLVSDDDQHIKRHKVVVSACSPVLKSILEKHPHQHPVVYLSGIKYLELRSLVNFMYTGQTDVVHDELNTFMNAASKLKIKALANCQINEERKKHFIFGKF